MQKIWLQSCILMESIPKRDAPPNKKRKRRCAALSLSCCEALRRLRSAVFRICRGRPVLLRRSVRQDLRIACLDPILADMPVQIPDAHVVSHVQQRREHDVRRAHAHGEIVLALEAQEVDAVADFIVDAFVKKF